MKRRVMTSRPVKCEMKIGAFTLLPLPYINNHKGESVTSKNVFDLTILFLL